MLKAGQTDLQYKMFLLNEYRQSQLKKRKHIFTIQNVPIKCSESEVKRTFSDGFTIQNVPIK